MVINPLATQPSQFIWDWVLGFLGLLSPKSRKETWEILGMGMILTLGIFEGFFRKELKFQKINPLINKTLILNNVSNIKLI